LSPFATAEFPQASRTDTSFRLIFFIFSQLDSIQLDPDLTQNK